MVTYLVCYWAAFRLWDRSWVLPTLILQRMLLDFVCETNPGVSLKCRFLFHRSVWDRLWEPAFLTSLGWCQSHLPGDHTWSSKELSHLGQCLVVPCAWKTEWTVTGYAVLTPPPPPPTVRGAKASVSSEEQMSTDPGSGASAWPGLSWNQNVPLALAPWPHWLVPSMRQTVQQALSDVLIEMRQNVGPYRLERLKNFLPIKDSFLSLLSPSVLKIKVIVLRAFVGSVHALWHRPPGFVDSTKHAK